jgi:hypothetical protein
MKVVLTGQLLLIKYKFGQEFRNSCNKVNTWILQKTAVIPIVNEGYSKISDWIYNFASRDLQR